MSGKTKGVLAALALFVGLFLSAAANASPLHRELPVSQHAVTHKIARASGSLVAVPRMHAAARPFAAHENSYDIPRQAPLRAYFCGRRARNGEPGGALRLSRQTPFKAEIRTCMNAQRLRRAAVRSAWKAYDEKFTREIMQGGKNLVRQVHMMPDWQEAIRPDLHPL